MAEFQQNVNYTSYNFPLEPATDGLHITQFCTRADQKVNFTSMYKIWELWQSYISGVLGCLGW
jgi:hypothetical protein